MTDLPDDWTTTTLGVAARSIRNGIFARRPNDEGNGTPILRISAVRDGRVDLGSPRYVEGVTAEQAETFGINAGDLLMTRYNGSRHLVGIPGIVPEHDGIVLHPDKLIRVVPDRDLCDPNFLNYQLQSQSVRDFLAPRIRTTAGQSGISGRDVKAIPLVLPPLDVQTLIAEVLDDHLSRLDAGVNYLNAALARAGSLRRALLIAAFSGRLTGAAPSANEQVQEIAVTASVPG